MVQNGVSFAILLHVMDATNALHQYITVQMENQLLIQPVFDMSKKITQPEKRTEHKLDP